MNFEEETWADNDSAKKLEALLFTVPDGYENRSTEKLHAGLPNTASSGKKRLATKTKVPSSSVANVQSKQRISLMQIGPIQEKADHSKAHKPGWRKRAFSKLIKETAVRKPQSTKKTVNESHTAVKDSTVHNAKRRKIVGDTNTKNSKTVTESKSAARNRTVKDSTVHYAKHQKIDSETSTKNSTCLTESRSAVLNRAVTTKLMAAQFRFINEKLYTRSSKEARDLFSKDKKLFQIYHNGYSQQIARWPTNPLDAIIDYIEKKPTSWVIGDFGCGDARLARSVKNKVHSFDLVACNKSVTIADIAHVPLPNESLDAVILCLSLMGTNFVDFISEANRTLKVKGILLIAEIESRFKNVLKFKNLMKNLGFQLKKEDKNSYFISFNFMKTRSPNKEIKTATGLLKPCVYKKR